MSAIGEGTSVRRPSKRRSWPVRVLLGFLLKLVRLTTLLVGVSLSAVLVAGGLYAVGRQGKGIDKAISFVPPPVGDLKPLDIRSQVFDRYGNLIATWRGEQNRVPVPLASVPNHLIQAILDIEDSEFYNHDGVNVKGVLRATAANVEAGGVAQGGSTITQQLVKLTILDSKQNVDRKVREALIARRIEKQFSKDQILEQYLNTIYFGEGAYGVQAASEQYFDKPVKELSVVESAFLAGMIRNPVGYDPVRFRDRSRDRRTVVLSRMRSLRHITDTEFDAFKRAPMPRPADRLVKPETYFLEAVKQSLLDDPRLGKTKTDRYNSVFSGGLRIRTTFDPYAQRDAEEAIAKNLPESASPEFAMALVSVDVDSGAVRAMVGGPGFDTYKYNLATQGLRQPGSSWKPFTLIAALESGISPRSTVSGAEPCPIPNPNGEPNPYNPKNSSEGSGATESIVNQLVRSNNCAFARLAWIVGYDRVASVARRLGITSRIDLVPAMALGVEEVRPIEMAGAYATIASGGQLRTPHLIDEVLDRDGEQLFKTERGGRQVISPQVASTATAAMQRVVTNGTGTAAQLSDRDVAGKTGTTNDYEDAWFVGFTSQVATAVWMGAPDAKISMRNVGGIQVMGGTYPARVWHDYMSSVLRGTPPVSFAQPDPSLFERGECLSVEKVLAEQRDAERKAERERKAAEKERLRLEREIEKQRRKDEAAKKSAAGTSVRGASAGWPMQDDPAPVASERQTSPPDPGGSISEGSSSADPSTKSTVKRRTKTKSKTTAKSKRRGGGCSDDSAFSSLASERASGSQGDSKKRSKTSSKSSKSSESSSEPKSKSKRSTKATKATKDTKATKNTTAKRRKTTSAEPAPDPSPVPQPETPPAPAAEPAPSP